MPPPPHINPINNSLLSQIPLKPPEKESPKAMPLPELPFSNVENNLFEGITPFDRVPPMRPLSRPRGIA